MFVKYDESILTYVASIRRYFGLSSSYRSDPGFDGLLEKIGPKKIFVLLVDGMGANLIRKKLNENDFLNRNMVAKVSTVFPPTTTAATSAIRNGKSPNENGWLGWCQYLKEVNDIIIPFRSCGFYNDIEYKNDIFPRYVPLTTTENDLKKIGLKARILFPSFVEDGCEDLDEMCSRLIDLSYSDEYDYIYAYWDKYDTYMHEHGPSSKICDSYLEHINYLLEKTCDSLNEDTLLVITADHGQVDIHRYYNLCGSPFETFFQRRPSLEQRAMSFSIHKDMEKEFEKLFKSTFENDFILLSKDQVKRSKLFGDHNDHPRFDEFIGDYLAIATSDMVLIYRQNDDLFYAGQHAGISDDELMVPVILSKR